MFYVFDEIATDSAGIADQVAVGPWGICAILVYDLPEGKVTLDSRSDQYMLNGRYFKEDLNERGTALVDELRQSIFRDPTAPVYYLVCFTSVGTEVGERKDYPRDAAYSVWELARCLIGSEPVFSQGDLDELATRIRRRYDRQPYIRPNQRVDGSADAREEDSSD